MSHHFHHHQLMLDALYCQEKDNFSNNTINLIPPLTMDHEFSCEDEELTTLLSKQQDNYELYNGFENNPSFVEARYEAIEWILKVVSHYSFSALTAVLAVNYLDRFLFSFQFHREKKPWMIQLVAVTCLSLAAKVEETQVPLLLDLQVEECKYVFEAKTIQKMELLVLTTLEWKMNPVNPISFLDYIIRRLGLNNHQSFEFLRRCENLLLGIISDFRFMSYLPSVMASAIMLHVIKNVKPCTLVEFQEQLSSILGSDKEKVEDCCRQVNEVASTIQFYSSNKRKYATLLGSPKGVMDMSFSSDNSNNSWARAASSVSSSPEPLSKKSKPQEDQHQSA